MSPLATHYYDSFSKSFLVQFLYLAKYFFFFQNYKTLFETYQYGDIILNFADHISYIIETLIKYTKNTFLETHHIYDTCHPK